jgi:hypothetical protein
VADQDAFASSMMAAVAAGPNGYVAVGTNFDPNDAPIGYAWYSSDGKTWTRSSDVLQGIPAGVIWDGQRFVAFGGGQSEEPAAIWTSADGHSWQQATDGPGFDEVTTLHVAKLGGALYAIGGGWGDSEGPESHVFKTWSSSDGLTWVSTPPDAAPPGMTSLEGLTAANGMLVAWGSSDVSPDFRPLAVRSTDGRTWDSANLGKADSLVWDVVGSDGAIVAVGSGPFCCEEGATAPVRAWTSADAQAWARAQFEPAAGNDQLEHVVVYGGGYVALGTDAGMPISWLSDDGSSWTETHSVPDAAIDEGPACTGGPCPTTVVNDFTNGPAGLVAVGQKQLFDAEGARQGWQSVVWFAPAANP